MIFPLWDRSQHLSETGPNQTGPNLSPGLVPTPKRDRSQTLNMIHLHQDPSQHLSGTQPSRSQSIHRTGPNPSVELVPTPQWDWSQPLNMMFLCWDQSQHLRGTGPNQTRSNPFAGLVPTPQYDLSSPKSIPTPQRDWTQLDRFQPLSGTGPNPHNGTGTNPSI